MQSRSASRLLRLLRPSRIATGVDAVSPAVPRSLFRSSLWDYARLRRLRGWLVRNSRAQLRAARVREGVYLNVGCGGNPHEDFINLDYSWQPRIDLCWDIARGLPLRRGSLRGVYSEHCLEHLKLGDVYALMLEFHELLAPSGTLRIVVPDGEHYLDLYQESKSNPGVRFPGGPTPDNADEVGITPMLIVNRAFRAFGHQFAYDYRTVELLLRRAGFVDIQRESYLQGRDDTLLIDYEKRAFGSLYVEATRGMEADGRSGSSAPIFDVGELVNYLAGAPARSTR